MNMGDSIRETRNLVYGSMAEQINLLADPYVAGSDRLDFKLDVAGITPGMVLASGLNVWYVTEVAPATKTVYVVPNYDGARSAQLSSGEVVYVRPRATDWMLFNEVNRVIVQMSSRTSGLYSEVAEHVQNRFGNWGSYELQTTEFDSIVAVRARSPWGYSTGGWQRLGDKDWRFNKHDNQLRIINSQFSWVNDIEVLLRKRFRPATDLLTDLVLGCGLGETMQDIPALGAAAGLLLTTEGRRHQVSAQSDPRKAAEVMQGSNSSAAREMRRRYEQRIDDEAIRLVNSNPYKISL
jgi:hypothetical protein